MIETLGFLDKLWPIVVVLIAVATAMLYFHLRKKTYEDVNFPLPISLRTDLKFGFYGTMHDQAEKTKGFVNLLWESQFQGHEKACDNMQTAAVTTVVDLANQCFIKFQDKGRNHKFNPDAVNNLRNLFLYMRERNVLQYFAYAVPMDEPNINVRSAEDLQFAINAIRAAASEFPELNNLKLAIIYAALPEEYWCADQFDLVGVDDYDKKSQIFVNGTYAALLCAKHPNAKTIILPGGAFGQDIIPFLRFAHNNLEVSLVLPFTWLGPMVPADKWVGLGDDANPLKPIYIAAGKTIVGA
jgi:hypothetical protein